MGRQAKNKGKLKISRVLDNTAAEVEIMVYLPAGADQDQTIQALYAFTDCEVSISSNIVLIANAKTSSNKPDDAVGCGQVVAAICTHVGFGKKRARVTLSK